MRDREWGIGLCAAAGLIFAGGLLAATRLSSPKSEAASPQKAISPREAVSVAKLVVRDVGEAFDAKHIEIRGVEAGAFDPAIWQAQAPSLLPDIRGPMLEPREGMHRNIYAPSVVQTKDGWRIYYGGWDGVPTPNDRIYLADTRDFRTFAARQTVIEHGDFRHVCNVNVTPVARGYAMICTVFPDANGCNKPATFFSDDGAHWNGVPGAFPATQDQIIRIDGYDGYAKADINGVNVLLFEAGKYRLYFSDFHNFGKVFCASGKDGKQFKLDGTALKQAAMVNDVKKFRVGERAWYLMGLHANGGQLFYTLSEDPMSFPPARVLCEHVDEADRYIVAIGWVTAGEQEEPGRRVLGCLYGAGSKGSLDANRIFARWLQKKAVIVAGDKRIEPAAALGPDRQLFAADAAVAGRIELLAEDGKTLLGEGNSVAFTPGRAYAVGMVP